MIVKGFTIALLLISLSGCASFVANKITSPKNINVEGNLGDLIVEKQICDNSSYCIKTMGLGDSQAGDLSLAFTFEINESHKVWRYEGKSDNAANAKPLADQLIVLFAGYSQPTLLLYMHQKWLQHITGANVIVVPSADNSENFKFGLDYASPIVAEIQRLKPKKVHLIGFSMGALAANAVEQEIDNTRLYLFAPMTDFEHSTKAIYDSLYQDTLYAKFVSKDTLEDAIQIVYEESETSLKDTDLLAKLDKVKSPTFIYASNADKVTDYSALNTLQNKNINVSIYEKLGHIEMVALASQNLLAEFVSDLLERPVLKSEVETLGVLCDVDDDDCLNQLPN